VNLADLLVTLKVEDSDLARSFQQIRQRTEQLGTVFGNLQNSLAGMAMRAAAALGMLSIPAGAFAAAVRFDEIMDKIRVATGATGQALESLGKSMRNVTANVASSAEQVGHVIGELNTRMGLTGATLESLTRQLVNLSRITGEALGPLVRDTTRLFASWGVETARQSQVLDYLFKVSQSTGIGVGRLLATLTEMGPVLRSSGMSLEYAAALMGQFEKQGVNAERGLFALNWALRRLATEGKDPQQALTELIERIKSAGTEAEAQQIGFRYFGRGALFLTEAIRTGRLEVGRLIETLKASRETIEQAAQETMSFHDKLNLLRNRVTLLLEPLGVHLVGAAEKLMELFEGALKTASNLANALGGLSKEATSAALAFGALAAAFTFAPMLVMSSQAAMRFVGILTSPTGLIAALGAGLIPAIAYGIARLRELNRELDAAMAAHEEFVRTGVRPTKEALESLNQWQPEVFRVIKDTAKETEEALKQAIGPDRIGELKRIGESASEAIKSAFGIQVILPAAQQAKQSAMSLQEALEVLGIKGAPELDKVRQAYQAIVAAFEAGQVSLQQMIQAWKALMEAEKAAGAITEQNTTMMYQVAGVLEERVQAATKRTVEAVADLVTASQLWGKQLEYHMAILPVWGQEILSAAGRLQYLNEQLDLLGRAITTPRIKREDLWKFTLPEVKAREDLAPLIEKGIQLREDEARALAELEDRYYAARDALSAGLITQQEYNRIADEYRRKRLALAGVEEVSAKRVVTAWEEMGRQVSTVITDLSRSLADLIFKGGRFGQIMVQALEDIAKAIVRIGIERLITQRILPALVKLLDHLGAVGRALGRVFGAGPSATAAGGAGGAAAGIGAGGAAAGGAAGLALAGITAGTAVAGVITGVRQEGTLNAIELNTRVAAIHLGNILAQANTYWPNLLHLVDYMWRAQLPMLHVLDDKLYVIGDWIRQGKVAAGGGVTINVYEAQDARETAKAVADELRRLGIVPA